MRPSFLAFIFHGSTSTNMMGIKQTEISIDVFAGNLRSDAIDTTIFARRQLQLDRRQETNQLVKLQFTQVRNGDKLSFEVGKSVCRQ